MSDSTLSKTPAASDTTLRHFLDLKDLDATTLRQILDVARNIKKMQQNRRFPLHPRTPLAGRTLGIILSKPSTRTRVSFEVGIRQLGGDAVILTPSEMQLGRGETIADTGRVLSRFVDALVLRTGKTDSLHALAKWSSVPVINGLTPSSHPVQILADILTFEEHRGPVKGRTFAWTGDGNNVLTSLIEGAVRFGFTLRAATPPDMRPHQPTLEWAAREGGKIEWTESPQDAVHGADCVFTDTWISMSDSQDEATSRTMKLEPYRVDTKLMALAAPDALFMHCLPAHIGEEVTQDVFEGKHSVVFDEAENRLHAQKGILAWAMGGADWLSAGQE